MFSALMTLFRQDFSWSSWALAGL